MGGGTGTGPKSLDDFDFKKKSSVEYIVDCYEAIPKEEIHHRIFFLHSILDNANSFFSFTSHGKEELYKMIKSDIERLEPQFYDWAKSCGF